MNGKTSIFPYFAKGLVVKGFGRGSKELGIPTANFPDEVVDVLPSEFQCGVYYGWAKVEDSTVHKMVMSVGWNPFYKNTKRTMETHILAKFDNDFYGSELKICVSGHIRAMKNFKSVEELITAINEDIACADKSLDKPEQLLYKDAQFFS